MLGFIGFPSAKDPEYNIRCPDKSICVCITELDYKLVEKWSGKVQFFFLFLFFQRMGLSYEPEF